MQTFVNGKPIPFAQLDLSQYAAIVFRHPMPALYDLPDRQAIQRYINAGGGRAVHHRCEFRIQLAHDAADSDQLFPRSLRRHRQSGQRRRRRDAQSGGDFVDPAHPLLNGVNSFTAEGVSSFTVPVTPPARVAVERVVAHFGPGAE